MTTRCVTVTDGRMAMYIYSTFEVTETRYINYLLTYLPVLINYSERRQSCRDSVTGVLLACVTSQISWLMTKMPWPVC